MSGRKFSLARRMIFAVGAACWLLAEGVCPAMESEKVLAFAERLMADGDHYRAITEFKRFLFLAPDDPQAPRARLGVACCYVGGEQWDEAVADLTDIKERFREHEAGREALWLLAETYYRMGKFDHAATVLDEFERRYPQDARMHRAGLLKSLCYFRFGHAQWAVERLEAIPADAAEAEAAAGLLSAAETLHARPEKSPALAAALSAVVPGAGQLYVGRARDAALAFLLNGLMIGGMAAAFHNDEPVAGALLGVVEAGWYFGNIYNAANNAHKRNTRAREAWFRELEIRFQLAPAGAALSMGW